MRDFWKYLQDLFDSLFGSNSGNWNAFQRLVQTPDVPRNEGNRPLTGYSGSATRPRRHKFTAGEIKKILRGLEKSSYERDVMMGAAMLGNLLDERMVRFFAGRERLFDKLQFVVQQYSLGRPCAEIAASVSYFSDADDVEDAIEFAARLIANHLNRQRL
jgi:hypothetical protein